MLQHTGSYQSLDPGSFSSGFLACRKTIIPHEETVLNWEITLLLDVKPCSLVLVLPMYLYKAGVQTCISVATEKDVATAGYGCDAAILDKFNELLEKLFSSQFG